jgi:hypothetical protein
VAYSDGGSSRGAPAAPRRGARVADCDRCPSPSGGILDHRLVEQGRARRPEGDDQDPTRDSHGNWCPAASRGDRRDGRGCRQNSAPRDLPTRGASKFASRSRTPAAPRSARTGSRPAASRAISRPRNLVRSRRLRPICSTLASVAARSASLTRRSRLARRGDPRGAAGRPPRSARSRSRRGPQQGSGHQRAPG